jgi:hypothetical protein
VSEVDVSPSTVTALNVSTVSCRRIERSTGAAIGASVNTKASIVAMSGAIMPEPLAMPLMRTSALPSLAVAVASFGKVSVVMIARAAARQFSGRAASAALRSTLPITSASSGSPITPVEAMNTSPVLQPVASAVSAAVRFTAAMPFAPVKALALPEFTTSAQARPCVKRARHHSTGADGHFERVRTPATDVPLSSTASSTSVRPS